MVKNKKIKRFMAGLLTCMLCIPMFSANLVYAEELPDEDTAIAENYWGDLEKDDSIVGGIYPKNLMKPQESVLKNVTLSKAWDSPSTGVYKNANTLTYTMGMDMFDYISKPELKDNEGDNGDPEYQDGKYHNPFHFSFDKDFIKDRDQLNVYGDISVNGNTEHDSVATHKVGDKLNVDFSVNLSNFGKFQNSRIWQNMNGQSAGMAWKHHGVDGVVSTDAEVVFSIKMPQGITVPDDANVTIEGLSNFNIDKKTVDGKLLIKLHKIQEKEGYMTAKNYYKLINKIAEVKIHIEGITVGENAPLNQPLAISGSVVGVHDEYITDNVDKARNKSSDNSDYDARAFYFFVAKQSKAGRDAAAPQDKPNLISYTFKVTAPAQNKVTFINGDKEYAKVKVENGKSISGDALDKESMPKDPTKAGYVFKEWNTKADGKGTAFTGKTIVNNDITVYAIFVKKPNNPRPNPNNPVPGRIDGGDRIETGIEISKKHYDKAKTVIVVRHDLFPDSMTASVLAKLKDAPILLNPTNKLDPRVGAEIKRLGASEVIIVGGQNSISEKVREELRIYDADKDVERIAGHDRYGTSEMVARRVVGITGKKNKAVVASGEVFPDALAVGTYASREGYPILLVRKDLVPTQITKAIKDLEIKNTYIAGGYNTISKSTELKLPGVLERMAGKTRYETAIAIARSKFADSKEAYIASGEEFADALAISPMSGKYNRPTLLVKSKAGQNKPVSDYVYFKNINRITAIGGYRYIPNDVLKELVN